MRCVDDGFTAKATNEEFTTGGFAVSDGAYGVEGYGFAVSHERSLSGFVLMAMKVMGFSCCYFFPKL